MRFIDITGLLTIDRRAIRMGEPPLTRLCKALKSQTAELVESSEREVKFRPRLARVSAPKPQPVNWIFAYFTSGAFCVTEQATEVRVAYRGHMFGPFVIFTAVFACGGALAAADSGELGYLPTAVVLWWLMFAIMRWRAHRQLRRWLEIVLTSPDIPPVGPLGYSHLP
ncbi:hypothetical protein HJG53_09670 [Sphingomonas sp. ID1715]|uniref:hypothetical protein n=1 Tax=Sphingomonas sp. ID1715 TaxID=1656898 RepID=UPI001489093E|nr:hypothetical protein [Sphingomonas sp. ID1715]NNM77169.1 hypothetical protein [Sphingomonas sp. ID1715]